MTPRPAAALLAAIAAAMLAGAYAFEHVGGLRPCVLCWWQRYAWMAALALAIAAAFAGPRKAGGALLALAAIASLAGAGIAGFHVGVEQHWWQGTAECGGATGGAMTAQQRLDQLLNTPVVRCDEIAWSMLGLSMAAWNGLVGACRRRGCRPGRLAPASSLTMTSDRQPLPGDATPAQRLEEILRVDHAGEFGAVRIYEGQLAVLGETQAGAAIRRMRDQEKVHYEPSRRCCRRIACARPCSRRSGTSPASPSAPARRCSARRRRWPAPSRSRK
jgi:disulfide bond formation protein DsbB